MSNKIVVVSHKAAHEIEKAATWYNKKSYELRNRFIEELDYYFNRIGIISYVYKIIDKDIHRCLMKIFPYVIFFSITPNEITILRVRHKKQNNLEDTDKQQFNEASLQVRC